MSYIAKRVGAAWGFDTSWTFKDANVVRRVATTPMLVGGQNVGVPKFALRYVSLNSPNFSYDISPSERDLILPSMMLGLVQHVEEPHWIANPQVGSTHGKIAAAHARLVSYPSGADLIPDVEGVGNGDVGTYLREWLKPVQDSSFNVAGGNFYDGYDDLLPLAVKRQLYADRIARLLWKDFGPRQGIPEVGWAMVQHVQQSHAGIEIDPDEAHDDLMGNGFTFMALDQGDPIAPDPGDPVAGSSDPA